MKKYNLNDLGKKEFSISYTINDLNNMILETEFKNTRPFILNEAFEKLANNPKLISHIDDLVKMYLLHYLTINKYELEIDNKKKEIDNMFDKWS